MTESGHHIVARGRLSGTQMALWLIYNAALAVGALLMAPILIPYVTTTTRRRRTVLKRLGWRDCRQFQHPDGSGKYRLWIHALSVGEVHSARTLVHKIIDTYPHIQIIFSASTLTGFEAAGRQFADKEIELTYFPYDWIVAIQMVTARINPDAVIIVETDIWPNFLIEMHRRSIPVYLVNMRLSDSAFQTYRRLKWAAGWLFSAFKTICVQTERDGDRLRSLGIEGHRISVTGNIKFDDEAQCSAPTGVDHWPQLKHAVQHRQVVVAGSTHDGEESALLEALAVIEAQMDPPLLIIAPRNPDRSPSVLALCENNNRRCCRLSDLLKGKPDHQPQIVVVDFIGALKQLYALADVAFVGGSLVQEGGHNPLEPAAWGKPVVFGLDMRDFHQIAAWLVQAGGARQASSKNRLGPMLIELLSDPELAHTIGERAKDIFLMHKGAVADTLACLALAPAPQISVEPRR